jgi:hypothetical protein
VGDARRAAAGALAAAALHAVLVLHGASWHSAVFDEVVYPAAGYATLRTGEVRLNREHPPLMKLLTGAAWLGTGLPVTEAPGWQERDQWRFGRHLLYGAGQDAAALLFRARVPVALLSAALLLGVWGAARRRWGPAAGWMAAAMYGLDPLVLAHAGLATTDLGAAAFTFGAAIAIPWALARGGAARTLAAGALLGAALSAKFSTVVVLAVLPVSLWLERRQPGAALRRAASILAVATGVLLAVYGRTGPGAWLEGLRILLSHDTLGHPTYAFGRWSEGGWWWYFPAAWAVKTPLVLLAAQLAGVVWALRVRARLAAGWPLLLLAGLFAGTAMLASLNLGVRHLLPMTPCLAVLAGGAGSALWGARSRLARVGLVAAGAVLAVGTLSVHPDEIADANLLAGGPRGVWRVLSDSNVDWGQALPSVEQALAGHPVRRLYLGYFGTADPHASGLRYVWLPALNMIERRVEDGPDPQGREWLAVSVTTLMDVYTARRSAHAWLRDRPMTAFPGHAIALYDITGDAEAFVRLGHTALTLGEPEAALAPLRRATELAPGDAAVHVLFARAAAGVRQAEEVDTACARALALTGPGSPEARACEVLVQAARSPL